MHAHVACGGKLRPSVKETSVKMRMSGRCKRQLCEGVIGRAGMRSLNVASTSTKTQQFDEEVACDNAYPFEMTKMRMVTT